MSRVVKKLAPIASIALPILAPGIGTGLGAALGATGAGASALGSGLIGAGLGGLSGGGLKGALLGGAGGALGGYAGGGGFGTAAGSTLSGGAQGATQGSGVLGSITRAAPGLGSAFGGTAAAPGLVSGGLTSGLGSNLGNILTNIGGSYMQDQSIEDAQAAQQAAIQQAQANIGTFNPEEYVNSQDYNFQLSEGQRALDAANAARGGFYSGAALKEAGRLGQGLAQRSYGDAYNRYAGETGQLNDLLLQGGNVAAGAELARGQNFGSGLANIFGTAPGTGGLEDELRNARY